MRTGASPVLMAGDEGSGLRTFTSAVITTDNSPNPGDPGPQAEDPRPKESARKDFAAQAFAEHGVEFALAQAPQHGLVLRLHA